MEWLAGPTALWAAAGAVPLLVVLYFLKLKRRREMVSSTLLWQRAVQDMQVNAPFKRLRRSLLLLLQLLILLLILAALGRPVWSLQVGPGRRIVLLIDRSASMNCVEEGRDGRTRLEIAREQAAELVESMRGRIGAAGTSDKAMVIAFDRHAKVMCNFVSDKRQLHAALAAIEPTDGPSNLGEAITVARAFADRAGDEGNTRPQDSAGQLELFSDGKIADLDGIMIDATSLNFHRIGAAGDNVGIVAMQARRSYERPQDIAVFATLANYGTSSVACDVQLSLDGNVVAVRKVAIGPRRAGGKGKPTRPAKVSISFGLAHARGGVLGVRQLRRDALGSDDAAWAVVDPPKHLSVLVVTGSAGSTAPLVQALEACPLARLDVKTPAEFAAMDLAVMGVDRPYDAIVLDNVPVPDVSALPGGAYIVFGDSARDWARPWGNAPAGAKGKVLRSQAPVDWRSRHPVLQSIDLGGLFVDKSWALPLPRDVEVLAEFDTSAAMAIMRRQGKVCLLVGFGVMDTNWPFEASFVMFCYNATRFMGHGAGRVRNVALEVGQAIVIEGLDPGSKPTVATPHAGRTRVVVDDRGTLRYPRTDRTGVYGVTAPPRAPAQFAVNLLNEAEGDVAPADEIVLSGQAVAPLGAGTGRSNVELWPFLAMAALVLVVLEWAVYNSRIRL